MNLLGHLRNDIDNYTEERVSPPFERVVMYSDNAVLAQAWRHAPREYIVRVGILARMRGDSGRLWCAAGAAAVASRHIHTHAVASMGWTRRAATLLRDIARDPAIARRRTPARDLLLRLAETEHSTDYPHVAAMSAIESALQMAYAVVDGLTAGEAGAEMLKHTREAGLSDKMDAWLAANVPPPTSAEVMTALGLGGAP